MRREAVTADTVGMHVFTDHLPFFIYVLVLTLVGFGFAVVRRAYRDRQAQADDALAERIARKRLEVWSDAHFPGVDSEPLA